MKWSVIAKMAINKDPHQLDSEMNQVRSLARKYMFWEALRDCDLFQSIFQKNSSLFNRVYFGTPHSFFRERALALSENKFELNPKIHLGPKNVSAIATLDLNHAQFREAEFQMDLTHLGKKLLKSISKDLYRPISIYQVFKDVFDDERFNPISSKEKTYKLIQKFRKDLKTHPSECSIHAKRGYGYRLRSEKPLLLIYPKKLGQKLSLSPIEAATMQVRQHFGNETFMRQSFCNALSQSDRSGNRILKEMVDEGIIEKIGGGRSTKYRLVA